MTEIRLRDVLDSTGAVLVRGASSPNDADAAEVADRVVGGVSTDTRTLKEGELFVALTGPNFDGNRFAAKAAERGAAGRRAPRRAGPREPYRTRQ